jgi:catechol 2,3-dioxygenase-like lactoylglutathione lyase family enzyme
MSHDASRLFTRLAPVLNVQDLAAERAFYEDLGLPVIYEGPEYPDFIAFGTETVHFGIQATSVENDPPSVLTTGSASWCYVAEHGGLYPGA